MWLTQEIKEYIRVKCEIEPCNAKIAREIFSKFNLETEIENVRNAVSKLRIRENIRAKQKPRKRLFFDIETSYYLAKVWDSGQQYVRADQFIKDKKVISIAWKWQFEDEVKYLTWDKKQDDCSMIKKFIKIMGEADEIIAHNGDNFDIKQLRTRAISHGLLMFPTYRTLDTLKKSRQYFSFASNALNYIGRYLNCGEKLHHEGQEMWHKVVENNDAEALKKMVEYNIQDVVLLEDVYTAIAPYIWHNTNFSVLTGGELWDCPECAGKDVEFYRMYTTPSGVIKRNMKCNDCLKQYRISNKTYLRMLTSINKN